MPEHPTLVEALGLRPFRTRMRQALIALRGAADVPPSQYDRSSLTILDPRLGIPLWAGRFVVPRRAIVTNLFNHRQTPVHEGWSVRRRSVEDFRGRTLTYDSHNGTDFCIPVGTTVCAPAAGRVVRVYSEFNRGGLKICIDHGDGLMTCTAHLARALVAEGDVLAVGQPYALSGYSGLDGFVTFPWGIPHIHFNTWLDGEPVDPFARPGEASLWIDERPVPYRGSQRTVAFEPSRFAPEAVDEVLEACVTAAVRDEFRAIDRFERRAAWLVAERNYYPTRFRSKRNVYDRAHARAPRLHLPFAAEAFDGIVFADER